MTDGRRFTTQELLRLHRQAFDEGARTILHMLRTTAEIHNAADLPHPTLDEIADQIEAIINDRPQ